MKNIFIVFLKFISLNISAQQKENSLVHKDSTAINFFRRTSGHIASDGGLTIALTDGSTLWLMGDSHVNDYDSSTGEVPCLFQVRNAALLQPKNDWNWHDTKTFIGNGPGIKSYFKNNTDDKYFVWPSTGIQIKDTIYVYCNSLMNANGAEGFGFAPSGNDYFAKIKYPEMKVKGYSNLQNFNGIGFGIGFIKDDKSGFVYVYGQKLIYAQNSLYVARFNEKNPSENWEFWNGKSWSKDVKTIAGITKQYGVEGTFQVAKLKNEIVVASSALSVGCDQGKEIFLATSDNITGPFTEKKLVYTIDDTLQGHYPFFYAAVLHPEFINNNSEVLLTYAINGYGKCVETCVNGQFNPDYYRLKAIRIPLNIIIQ